MINLTMILGSDIKPGDIIGIIIAIIGIILTIVYGIPTYKSWRLEKRKQDENQKNLFKESGWIDVKELSYSSLDFIREMKQEINPSSQKDVKEVVLKILSERKETEKQNHILLVGPSLSGKTHLTVSILKALTDAYVLIPNEDSFFEASKNGFEFPEVPENAQYRIILLDNFHEFFKGGDTTPNALIHQAIEKGFTLWANCISIEEYERIKPLLDFKKLEYFQVISLSKKLTNQEAESIAKIFGESVSSLFDGTIGSIIYLPEDIIQHYNDLKSDVIASDILLFIKQAYMLGAFKLPYSMKIDLIKKAFSKKYSPDFSQMMNAFKKIEQKGFIAIDTNHEFISFDSVYLNGIVEPDMKPKDFFSFWKDVIPKNILQYNYLISSTKSYTEAVSFYTEMKASEIVPNTYTYNALIHKSPDYQTALVWNNNLKLNEADAITYSSLISKSPDYKTALNWYDKIKDGEADIYCYNSLISKSPEYKIAYDWYSKIKDGEANFITYSSLISLSPDYKTALTWYDKIKEGEADVVTYNSLIRKSPDYPTALKWYNKIKSDGATFITYSSLINLSPDYKTALEWYIKIREGEADVITYNSLIKKSPDYYTALNWSHKIKEGEADFFTYNSLISKSPDYKTALDWYNKIEDGKADVITYSALIRQSPDYPTAVTWYEKIKDGKADVITYNSLIKKSPDYSTALEWYNKIKEGEADVIIYNSLIEKATEIEIGLSWLKIMEEKKMRVTDRTYGALIKSVTKSQKTNRFQIAISLHDEMKSKGIKSNVIIYTNLISLAPDFEQAFKLLNQMVIDKDDKNRFIEPNERTKIAIEGKAMHNREKLDIISAWFNKKTIN